MAAGMVGCGHGRAVVEPAAAESAYLAARRSAGSCRSDDGVCCAERAREARAASGVAETARAARLWHEVALACPQRSEEAAAAVRTAGPASTAFNVSYQVQLPPSYRLFWVSSAAGGRALLPAAGAADGAGTQSLTVEVHAIEFRRGRPGPLMVLERRFDLPAAEAAMVTVVISEAAPSDAGAVPLAIGTLVQKRSPPARRLPGSPSPSAPAPRLESSRLLHVPVPRVPQELGASVLVSPPAVRLCLDSQGAMHTVRFLEPAHPRVMASLIDMFRDSRHEPYRVNDLPVPSCDVVPASGTTTMSSR